MKIDITRIPADGSVSLSETCERSILDLEEEGVTLASPLEIQAEVSKGLSGVNIKANARGKISFVCGRCLENFEKDINKKIEFDYPVNSTYPVIDLTEQVRQEVILSEVPLKPVCNDNCKGLCPNCGRNLNKEKCNCDKKLK